MELSLRPIDADARHSSHDHATTDTSECPPVHIRSRMRVSRASVRTTLSVPFFVGKLHEYDGDAVCTHFFASPFFPQFSMWRRDPKSLDYVVVPPLVMRGVRRAIGARVRSMLGVSDDTPVYWIPKHSIVRDAQALHFRRRSSTPANATGAPASTQRTSTPIHARASATPPQPSAKKLHDVHVHNMYSALACDDDSDADSDGGFR